MIYGFICSVCNKKPARRKVVTYNAEKKKVLYLCDDCYHERQKKATISIMDSIANKMTNSSKNTTSGIRYESMCSKCKTTETEFRNTGLLGCENCYNDLAPAILAMIRSSQGNLAHIGKNPNKANEKKQEINKTESKKDINPITENHHIDEAVKKEASEVLSLKQQLEDAIMAEDFELACQLRDKINMLEKEESPDA